MLRWCSSPAFGSSRKYGNPEIERNMNHADKHMIRPKCNFQEFQSANDRGQPECKGLGGPDPSRCLLGNHKGRSVGIAARDRRHDGRIDHP